MTAPGVSRRTVLAGGAALAFLTACGGGDDEDTASTTTDDGVASSSDELTGTLLVLLPQQGVLTTGGPQRVPVAIADAEGVPVREGLEPREFQIRAEGGEPATVTVEPHGDGVPTPYYPVRFIPSGPGIHEITSSARGSTPSPSTSVRPRPSRPSASACPRPTRRPRPNARGVDPICTRTPRLRPARGRRWLRRSGPAGPSRCPIATPEFCQTAICGPVLDLLIEALPDYPTITGIHAEVYADPRGRRRPHCRRPRADHRAYALPFEPTLYLVDATGTVVSRLDSVYDRVELREALDQIA